ncbi:ferredoxin [Streptomyces sp. NBC_00237]|uniref:ferredoxin n=1 Tax=Streptomyces sp. NBC_00237 TaxID=2975687 RepID=UPI00225708C1|nr:ferredoxin [Streptomyces sp. NBC_00237]MCX5200079.1 ferredoxin [Streptomyces sp. NBC_00237]
MRITTEREQCVGAGQCAMLSPDLFDQDDDGLVVVLREPEEGDRAELMQAVDLCPSSSIQVHG